MPATLTFKEVAERFLSARLPYLKPNTRESYVVSVRQLCAGEWGLARAAARRLRPESITGWVKDALARGLTPGAVNVRLRVLRTILHWAEDPDVGLVERAPKVRLLRVAGQLPGRALGRPELDRLLGVCGPRDRALVLVLATGGLRIDEALHLQWQDVEGDRLAVTAKPEAGWSPKSHQARVVFVPEATVAALAAIAPTPRHGGEWVFQSQRGGRLRSSADLGRRLFTAAGLHRRGRVWHELRRAAATSWHRNGIPLDTIRRLLGHANLAVTQRYLLEDEDALRAAARRGLM